ncbi:OmcA/MtrC family decaheme c-type cytochrome [Shewanella atlantica]|uniref:OmcA/MtrC family decaheme c-type cytochrome n=1 Tax=Shewanella atlantica TaxID=271099 RepID=A0A431WG73_9GAMM|nr:OmcA/MtrC family decaheme c-type cytochrome [Shewanella atlantica]RTR34358.1 OmcA/MtrC family decaheme c-type cytochrome [Shewanella atlantica]
MMNVKNNKFALLLAASAVSMALTGCGGDDGTDGNPGKPDGPAAEYINTLNLDVTKVTYVDGMPSIEVFATNEEDLPVVGLKDFEVKKVAQLLPQGSTGAGDNAQWQVIGSQKTFIDNQDGSYTFNIEVEGYNSALTQRYNVIAKASTLLDGVTSVPQAEIAEDFSGEGYEATYTKDIVSTASCNACHAEGEKIYHSYMTQETCATCHTKEYAEERGKPEIEWSHLIHNVHNSAKGYKADRDTGEFTKDAVTAQHIVQNNCTNCHVAPEDGTEGLTEWGNWTRVPTMETCTSCHVNIDFEAGQGHSQQADNSNCVACHNASWTEELHTEDALQKKAVIDQIGMNATLTAVQDDKSANLTISFTDSAGNVLDATTLLPKIKRVESLINVGPNFPIMGYKASPGNGEAHVSLDLVLSGELANNAEIADGNLVINTGVLPFGAAGTDADTAFSFIGLEVCSDGAELINCAEGVATTSMKAELAHGTLSGEAASVRHTDSVNFAACESCHGTEWELHKGYHAGFVMTEQLGREVNGQMTVGVDGCVACHTPDGTYAKGANKGALEMKLHVVHGEQGIIKDCTQCHNDFNLDAFKVKGALATSVFDQYGPNEESLYTTPIAATCTSCHKEDSTKLHAVGQGAIIDGSYEAANDAAQLETCFFCHNPAISDHTQVKM